MVVSGKAQTALDVGVASRSLALRSLNSRPNSQMAIML